MIQELSKKSKLFSVVYHHEMVSGGSINRAYFLNTDGGKFFIKINYTKDFPDLFVKEKDGLITLKKNCALFIPKVLEVGVIDAIQYLILEWIEEGKQNTNFDQELGAGLADLHRNSAPQFSYPEYNYIGSLVQKNNPHNSWSDFFITERIAPLIQTLYQEGHHFLKNVADELYRKIPNIFPDEKPALLHGDLWSGNLMCTKEGQPALVDPAVYYGNREMDIAMSKLFGGFSKDFYNAYNESFPLAKDWEKRIDLCNLYPLLVHAILFGPSYLSSVQKTIQKYI